MCAYTHTFMSAIINSATQSQTPLFQNSRLVCDCKSPLAHKVTHQRRQDMTTHHSGNWCGLMTFQVHGSIKKRKKNWR